MSERKKEDEREEQFPEQGIRADSIEGLDEAYRKFNRRKGTPQDYKGDRTRRSDRTGEKRGSSDGKRGNEIVFGKKTA